MANADKPDPQKTQPLGIDPKTGRPYPPADRPVPRREAIDTLLKRAAKAASDRFDRLR
jgi:hypothetical protein